MTKTLPKPSVLMSVGRSIGSGSLEEVYIAGLKTHFNELLELAGGRNVFDNAEMIYPMVTAEGIINLNPDIIIDIVAETDSRNLSKKEIIKEWHIVSDVNAVKNHKIFVLTNDYTVIPGPRIILLLQDFARIVHPEIDWDFNE